MKLRVQVEMSYECLSNEDTYMFAFQDSMRSFACVCCTFSLWPILRHCNELNTKPPANQTAGVLVRRSNQILLPIFGGIGGKKREERLVFGRVVEVCLYRIVYQ